MGVLISLVAIPLRGRMPDFSENLVRQRSKIVASVAVPQVTAPYESTSSY